MVTEREHTRNGIDRPIGTDLLKWAGRQPDLIRRFAAKTAFIQIQNAGRGQGCSMDARAIAHNVAKMQGGE